MSNFLLEYLNNEIRLSKKIENIEKDFSNGYFFAELLHKLGCLNTNFNIFKKEPKSELEIRNNFNILKSEFTNLEIHFDDEIINSLINNKKNLAKNLIYKIKTAITRKNIDFDNIMKKIKISYEKLEEIKNRNKKFIKSTQNFFKKNTTHITKSRSSKDFSSASGYSNITSLISSPHDNKKFFFSVEDNEKNNNKITALNKKIKLKPLKKYQKVDLNNNKNINEIAEESSQNKTRNKDIEKIQNDISINKDKNNKNNKNKTMNDIVNFSDLENNIFKIGYDIKEVDPNIKKYIFGTNQDLINTKIIKIKCRQKLEENKKAKKIKKTKKQLDLEQALKNSCLKNIEKPLNLEKNKSLYKIKIYEKKRKLKYPIKTKKEKEELKKNSFYKLNYKFELNNDISPRNWYKTQDMNFSFNYSKLKKNLGFTPDEYIKSLDKKEINDTKKRNEIKRQKINDDIFDIEDIVNLIIDISDEAYKYQQETKKEFINLPEYKNWIELFLEGKTCKKSSELMNINLMKNYEEDEDIDDDKKNKKNKKRKKTIKDNKNDIKKEKIKNEIIKSEYCKNEFIDYIFNRGYWNNKLYVPNDYYGISLHIYQVLGDDITNIISSGKVLFQGMMQVNYNKMKNEEFELKEDEKDNIKIPSENKRNQIFGELIELNYDNINIKAKENENNINLNVEKIDISYIPVRICLIGSSYSGRKTQAEIIHEKYPEIKIYSISNIIIYYINEYQRLYINNNAGIENNTNKSKNNKKNILKEKEELNILETEKKNFEPIKVLIEDYALKKINELSDDIKIKLLIYEIKKDFPYKTEKEINKEINDNIKRKEEIENEIKDIKKEPITKNKNKIEANLNKLKAELDSINKINYKGFILIDFPNNIEQHMKLEEYISGFVPNLEKVPDKRDLNLYLMTNTLDKPYYNISYLSKGKNDSKSCFNQYILLYCDEENIMKHINKKVEENNEKEIPNSKNKKIEEKLDINIDNIKQDLKKYLEEIPKIIDFLGNFNNLKIINKNDKNEINKNIEEEIIKFVDKFEGNINKNYNDFINMNANLDLDLIDDFDESNKYFKRLNEIKKLIKKELSEDIIQNWTEYQNKYIFNIKEFIYNLHNLKKDIINKMNSIQDDFITFLNSQTNKKDIINLFLKKYKIFLKNFSALKNNLLVKEEVEKDIIVLTENLWDVIQQKKLKAIEELNNIKNKNYIGQKIEYFFDMLCNLFYAESEFYLHKINLLHEFYNEFENKNKNFIKPEYKLKKSELMKNTYNLEIYVPKPEKEKKKKIKLRMKKYEEEQKEYLISPKIDKIYKNCFKLLFNYEKKLKEEGIKIYNKNKARDEFNNFIKKKKIKTFKKQSTFSIISENKIINPELELKTALYNEKVKYKLRLVFLKFFGEKFLSKLNDIDKIIFENMDNWIIQSVDAQNNAKNYIINKIKQNILKLSCKDMNNIVLNQELDVFNIYEKKDINFEEYKIEKYNLIKKEDKIFYINELYKIYLDLKLYEIQNNYVTLESFIDIFFKKHIFDYNSQGLMNCFKELLYNYFHKFITKFKIKTNKGQNLIKLDRLFTILALFNEKIPDKEDISRMLTESKKYIKYNYYISRDDFLKIRLWFEKNNIENKKEIISNIKTKIDKKTRKTYFNTKNGFLFLMGEKNKNKDGSKKEENEKKNFDKFGVKKNIISKKESLISEESLNLNNNESKSNISIDRMVKKNLKEILFSINKNYNNEINIYEFFDIISLKFDMKLKNKSNNVKIKYKEENKVDENNNNDKMTYFENIFFS